jgi:DNA-directed RNA polymerase subunit RPC12/RpoP
MNAIDRLFESIDTISEIRCSSCGRMAMTIGDGYDAAYEFKNKGWNVTIYGNVYCPECSKKKLKK